MAARAEAPRQLDGLRDADPRAGDELDVAPGGGRGAIATGPAARSSPLRSSSIASACVSLPGPEHSSASATEPAPLAHQLDPVERLERADQHRGADALRLADGVEERVDPVGAVHVGAAGRAEQRRRARREADERVAGRLAVVVGLRLDDHAAGAGVRDDAADEVARDLEDRAVVEGARQRAVGDVADGGLHATRG